MIDDDLVELLSAPLEIRKIRLIIFRISWPEVSNTSANQKKKTNKLKSTFEPFSSLFSVWLLQSK